MRRVLCRRTRERGGSLVPTGGGRAANRSGGTRRAQAARMDKAKKLERERNEEQSEGLAESRRGSPPAASDRPEGTPPHPQDVNEISEPR